MGAGWFVNVSAVFLNAHSGTRYVCAAVHCYTQDHSSQQPGCEVCFMFVLGRSLGALWPVAPSNQNMLVRTCSFGSAVGTSRVGPPSLCAVFALLALPALCPPRLPRCCAPASCSSSRRVLGTWFSALGASQPGALREMTT